MVRIGSFVSNKFNDLCLVALAIFQLEYGICQIVAILISIMEFMNIDCVGINFALVGVGFASAGTTGVVAVFKVDSVRGRVSQLCILGDFSCISKRESLMRLAGEEFVIIDDFGWPRNPDGYNALVKRVAKKAGIKDIHPHMFRHTFVSLLMSNPDIGVATVAAEAGHAQPSTTLMIYTQQYKKRRESIRNQLSRELYEK